MKKLFFLFLLLIINLLAGAQTLTVATLRSLASPSANSVYQTNDYGGGQWYYDASDSTTPDNLGTVLISSTAGGRYKRIYNRFLDTRWFGTKGDGANDDKLSIQATFDAAKKLKKAVIFTAGTYLISSAVTPPDSTEIYGVDRSKSVIKLKDSTNSFVFYKNGGKKIYIHDMGFDGGKQSSFTNGFLLDGVTDVRIVYCNFINTKQSIWLNNSAGNPARIYIGHNEFNTVKDFALRALDGIPTQVVFEFNHIDSVLYSGNPNVTVTAVAYSGKSGQFVGNQIDYSYDTAFILQGPSCSDNLVHSNQIHTRLVGIFTGTGTRRSNIIGNNIQSDSDFAVHVQDLTQGQAEAVVANNTIHDCGKNAISCEGVYGVTITGNYIARVGRNGTQDNWKSGIAVTSIGSRSCSNISICGNVILDDAATKLMKYGVFFETPCKDCTVSGNTVTDATTQNYQYATPTGKWQLQNDYGMNTVNGSSDATLQTFKTNVSITGALSINSTQTVVSGSLSGGASFSQPEQGSSYKKIIIYCSSLSGTASYTYPTAFLHPPAIVITKDNFPAMAGVTITPTATAVTITSTTTQLTGFIILEGY